MTKAAWILAPAAFLAMMAGGAGSTMAGFTAEANVAGSAQPISLPTALPVSLRGVTEPSMAPPTTGPVRPLVIGTMSNTLGTALSPEVMLDGPTGVNLVGRGTSLPGGSTLTLAIKGLAGLKPGKYPLTVTVQLGGFSESSSTVLTVTPKPLGVSSPVKPPLTPPPGGPAAGLLPSPPPTSSPGGEIPDNPPGLAMGMPGPSGPPPSTKGGIAANPPSPKAPQGLSQHGTSTLPNAGNGGSSSSNGGPTSLNDSPSPGGAPGMNPPVSAKGNP